MESKFWFLEIYKLVKHSWTGFFAVILVGLVLRTPNAPRADWVRYQRYDLLSMIQDRLSLEWWKSEKFFYNDLLHEKFLEVWVCKGEVQYTEKICKWCKVYVIGYCVVSWWETCSTVMEPAREERFFKHITTTFIDDILFFVEYNLPWSDW
mgnify:CR=1 FL=1